MRRLASAALLTLLLHATARAQDAEADPRCSDPSIVGAGLPGSDACEKVKDLFRYMNPQLGAMIAGGNATLGQGGTLGGPGRFTVGLRANVLQASIPVIDEVPVNAGAAQRSVYETDDQFVPMPVFDGAVGIFRGFPAGATHIGGVDLLVNVAYLPEIEDNGIEITTPDGSWKLGLGARIGILEESLVMPGLSVSYFRRDLPTVSLTARSGDDQVTMNELEVETTAWRLVVSKSFLAFGLAAGIGRDDYDTNTEITYVVNDGLEVHTPSEPIPLTQDISRTNMFVDLSLNLTLLKLVVEIGRVSGDDVPTFNTIDPGADEAKIYGALGLRLRI
jgi:hypothetical protein